LRHNIARQFLRGIHNKTTIYHHLLTLSGEKKILDLYISLNEEDFFKNNLSPNFKSKGRHDKELN